MKTKEAVILLHGLGLSSYTLLYIEHALAAMGYKTINVDYPSRGYGINDLFDIVSTKIYQENDTLNEYSSVHFVGHSLGGLLARMLVLDYKNSNLGMCVVLGSPNNGSSLAKLLSSWSLIRGHFGPALFDICTNSEFIDSLQSVPAKYALIAGTRSKFTPFGRWFKDINDGTVLVSEMIPDGLDENDVYRFDVSHSSMLFSVDVKNKVIELLCDDK